MNDIILILVLLTLAAYALYACIRHNSCADCGKGCGGCAKGCSPVKQQPHKRACCSAGQSQESSCCSASKGCCACSCRKEKQQDTN